MKQLLFALVMLVGLSSFATTLELGLIASANLSKGVDWEKNNYQTPYVSLTQKLDKWYISGYDSVRLNNENLPFPIQKLRK